MQNSNNLQEDLPRQHQKRSNDEDISGPDLKKARNLNDGSVPFRAENHPNHSTTIDLCNHHPAVIQEPQMANVQPTTSTDPSTLPARSSNNLFLQRIEPNQSIHIDICNDRHPVVIQEPNIPHVEVEHVFMQPTTSKHPSSLPASVSNNLSVESMPPSISQPNYCEEIYRELRAMFPNIDKDYLRTFCPANPIPEVSHEMLLNKIVDTILMNEHNWVKNDMLVFPYADDAYEQLTAIFPNADPLYLRSAAENFTNENDMTRFIEEKLKTSNYPTREQYFAKMKVTEEQQRYTTHFNVEQFLTLLPDPFKHFENAARKCKYSLIAVEFLKNYFNNLRVLTINKTYRLCKYNISIAAKDLRKSTDFIQTKRRAREIPTDNIQMLQEMAFVRHHEQIRQQVQAVRQREQEEFNLLKARGGLLTCSCCFDEECMPSKCSTCDNGHIFCNSCIIDGTDAKLADGETHVPCFLDCGSEFSIATFQKVLPPTKLCIFLKKRQASEVAAAGLEGLVCCPFCDFASIPAEGDKMFKCFNPECMKESCIMCKEPNHVPYKCGDIKRSEKARIYIEEKMTEALTRTCYKCKKTFFKEEGCNKMTCACGAQMCYICSQPVNSYSHFAGQGSDEVGKCPLWTDNKVLNSETVRRVEEEARKEVLRQDPTVKFNTSVLAPAAQPARPGPHVGLSDARTLANTLAAQVLNKSRFDNPQ